MAINQQRKEIMLKSNPQPPVGPLKSGHLRLKADLRPVLMLILLFIAMPLTAGPVIQSWQTSNGAKVLFVPAPEIPMLDVRIVFDAGSARSVDKAGLASLTNAMLSESVGEWSADQVAERLESVGANLSSGARRDMAWLGVRSLTEAHALSVALETLTAMLAEPQFAKGDMERLRKMMLVGLSRSEQSPGSVAAKAFSKRLFGDHPYASDPNGTVASIEAMSRDDLVMFHDQYYVGNNATIAITGAIDRQQAEKIAEQVIGQLPAGQAAVKLPTVAKLDTAYEQRIEFPSSQSHILLGQPGMKRGDPDYFVLYVGNHILGGSGLVSILSDEVREKRGLSYSTYSYFAPMRQYGQFQMGLQTKTSQVDEALKVLRDTLQRYIDNGPTAAQLTAAKENITGGFPLRIASNSKIVEYLTMIGFYGLPLDYLDRFNSRVEAVSVTDIKEAFARRLNPQKLVTVVVGQQAE
ncbi:MAG: insulinase family protein [Candidatus Polarisedimenticolaceae bacterium]|nr:insulinase family protein [Candidatus Polarisedimenticolaceae bacterium]